MKCPVCKKEIKSFSANPDIKMHSIAKARDEAFKAMLELYKYHAHDFRDVSRIVMLRWMPHFQYLRKNKLIHFLKKNEMASRMASTQSNRKI